MSVIDHDETNKEKSSDGEIQILSIEANEIQENFDSPINKNMDFIQIEDDVERSENEDDVDSNMSAVDQDSYDETIVTVIEEQENHDPTNSEMEISIAITNERKEEFDSSINEECKYDSFDKSFSPVDDLKEFVHAVENEKLGIDCDSNDEIMKEKSSEGEIQIPNESENESQENFDLPINEEIKCDYCDKSFTPVGDLRKHSNIS